MFEEGYNKDYIYEKRKHIPDLESNLYLDSKTIYRGPDMILLTMQGAIKFNMWKRTEGGKISKYYLSFHFN